MRRYLPLLALCVLLAGCNKDTPTTPTQPCVTANTAEVTFANRSNINATYDVLIDGAKVATVAPQANSAPIDVAAGVSHTFLFRYTNTQTLACNPLTPAPAQCSATTYTCTF